jgi:hypothetical protein
MIALLLLVVSQTFPASEAMDFRFPSTTVPLLTQRQLEVVIGSEAEAKRVLGSMIEDHIGARLREGLETAPLAVNILSDQMPLSWLPHLDGVRFEHISAAQAEDRCQRRMWVKANVHDQTLTVVVGNGNECGSNGLRRAFTRSTDEWTQQSGLVGGVAVSHCGCVGK